MVENFLWFLVIEVAVNLHAKGDVKAFHSETFLLLNNPSGSCWSLGMAGYHTQQDQWQ
jgi:hypothetical protein